MNKYKAQIDDIYFSSFNWCAKKHQLPLSFYHLGFHKFHLGDYISALDDINKFIDRDNNFTAKTKLLKGEIESEIGLYQSAIQSLTESIKLCPSNKEAYFERAACYFELGDFDKSLSDYLSSGFKPTKIPPDSDETIAFSLGLTKGVIKGGIQASLEFIPSILDSLHGLGQGLWAFSQDPVQVSKELVQASQACIEFIKNHTPQESFMKLVPELKDLLDNWDQYKDAKKGEITGHIIGKYGVSIFAGVGISKGAKAYRELKKANNILTYEAMALSKANKKLIKLEVLKRAKNRKEILKRNIKIKPDDQGKHIKNHRNYIDNKSIIEHPNLQKLVNKHAGTGIRSNKILPGKSGYQEIVNFGEFIGYDIDFETSKKTATTWGKIHYAKDGVHVVPIKPRD